MRRGGTGPAPSIVGDDALLTPAPEGRGRNSRLPRRGGEAYLIGLGHRAKLLDRRRCDAPGVLPAETRRDAHLVERRVRLAEPQEAAGRVQLPAERAAHRRPDRDRQRCDDRQVAGWARERPAAEGPGGLARVLARKVDLVGALPLKLVALARSPDDAHG